MTPPTEPLTVPARSTLIDIVKGFAILLVVYGHTAQGLIHRNWWTGRSSVISDTFVYSFHMPAFFFVAGLFLSGSLERRGPVKFVADKCKTILYPYILWVVVSAFLEPLIGQFKMSTAAFDWKKFLLLLVSGDASWFLPVLFVCQLVALVTWKLPSWLRLAIALVAAALMPLFGPSILYITVREFCFLAAGMLIGRMIFRLADLPVWAAAAGAILFFTFQFAVTIDDGMNAQFGGRDQWLAVVLGFTGTAGLILLSRTIDGTRLGDVWAWIGRASLAIYLLSAYPQGAFRELLLRLLHTHALLPQLIVPSLAATILPAIVWHQKERWHLGWLFHWPGH
jgi:fucose 4-O-acetylase-like acetyltransferase